MSYRKVTMVLATCSLLLLLAGCGGEETALESASNIPATAYAQTGPDVQEQTLLPTQPDSASETESKGTVPPLKPSTPPTEPERVFESPHTQQPSTASSSQQKQPVLEDYEREVVQLVNQARGRAGYSPLKENTALKATARLRARECAQQFSHTRPDGSSFDTAYPELGFRRAWGENIAMGYKNPAQVMEGWMNSDGHRANILNPDFEEIAVGCYQQNGKLYWVQNFITIG